MKSGDFRDFHYEVVKIGLHTQGQNEIFDSEQCNTRLEYLKVFKILDHFGQVVTSLMPSDFDFRPT